jgi:hypothetical protein
VRSKKIHFKAKFRGIETFDQLEEASLASFPTSFAEFIDLPEATTERGQEGGLRLEESLS